jgi:hypothetical protein
MPARSNSVGGIDVFPVDRDPTDAAELLVLGDELAVLGQDLDPMVVAVGDLSRPYRSNLTVRGSSRASAGLAMVRQKLAGLVEHRIGR